MSLADFTRAMTDGDRDAIVAALAEDVVLHSPVTSRPFHGRAIVGPLLCAAREVLEGLAYTTEMAGPGVTGLVFTATVGGKPVSGVDLVVCNEAGEIADFTAMLRPLSGAQRFNEAMGPRVAPLLPG